MELFHSHFVEWEREREQRETEEVDDKNEHLILRGMFEQRQPVENSWIQKQLNLFSICQSSWDSNNHKRRRAIRGQSGQCHCKWCAAAAPPTPLKKLTRITFIYERYNEPIDCFTRFLFAYMENGWHFCCFAAKMANTKLVISASHQLYYCAHFNQFEFSTHKE